MLKYTFSILSFTLVLSVSAQSFSLSGQVLTDTDDPAGSVLLEVLDEQDEVVATQLTDCSGNYLFEDLTGGTEFTVRVSKEGSPLNGNSTFDLVLISKYLLGSGELENSYRISAADIDESGSISVLDLLRMRALILGIQQAYPGSNWLFFRPGDQQASSAFDIVLTADLSNYNLITIKKGDVNGSAFPCE